MVSHARRRGEDSSPEGIKSRFKLFSFIFLDKKKKIRTVPDFPSTFKCRLCVALIALILELIEWQV